MKLKLFRIYPALIVLLASCAVQVPPDGGLKDTEPPKITEESPPNYSTNFQVHDFSISFDEFIQLKDLPAQLIVSPPLKNAPVTKLSKKTLRVHLDDTLSENTTYTLNFGNAISDNSENNALQNYQYVFSTGPILDSLSISGIVTTATDKKPLKDALVMLYREMDDSIPFKFRPDYFAKSDDSGSFRIRNISPASYRVFALLETDGDYLYSGILESIGFSDSVVKAPAEGLSIKLFKERLPMQMLKGFAVEPGQVNVVFSGAADTIPIHWMGDTTSLKIFTTEYSRNKDTLSIWYKNLLADSLHLNFPSLPRHDTLLIRLLKNDPKITSKRKFQFVSYPLISSGLMQDLNKPLLIVLNHPVMHDSLSAIQIMEDSIVMKNIKLEYKDRLHKVLQINPTWQDGRHYSVFIPPGVFTDIHGLKNDSLLFNFITRSQSDYGSVAIHFHGKVEDGPFILQLLDEKENVSAEAFVKINTDSLVSFTFLEPHTYKLKVIYDKNNNGRWDTGNYLQHLQPEEIGFYPEGIVVRANWDVDIKWLLGGK